MNDMRIPDGIDTAIRQASAALPAQVWDLDSLKSRTTAVHGLRRWRRVSRRLAGIAAGAVVVVVAGSAALVIGGSGPGTPPAHGSALSWIFAVDADHLYAVRSGCEGCPEELLGSDDGGMTWTRRTDQTDQSFRLTVGPEGALLVEGIRPAGASPSAHAGEISGTAISTDGGRTWTSVVDDPEPWPSLPAGAILTCGSGTGCPLGAIDPQTGRKSPLPGQPPDSGGRRTYPVRGTIWVDTQDVSALSASVSRDGGRTWSTESQPCQPAGCGLDSTLTPGLDDSTVFRVRLANPAGEVVFLRSFDAGRTWQRFAVTGAPATSSYGGQAAGIVAPDGSLIVAHFAGVGTDLETWILGPGDTAPRAVRLTGLPEHLGGTPASALTGNADTGYLLKGSGFTVYRSLDGLTWWPLLVEASA
jgi:hypothetical protein